MQCSVGLSAEQMAGCVASYAMLDLVQVLGMLPPIIPYAMHILLLLAFTHRKLAPLATINFRGSHDNSKQSFTPQTLQHIVLAS